MTLGVFNPRHMPNAINSEVTLQEAVATGCTILEVVPSFLEVRGSEKAPNNVDRVFSNMPRIRTQLRR